MPAVSGARFSVQGSAFPVQGYHLMRNVLKRAVLRAGYSDVSYALRVMRGWSRGAAINPEMMISKGTVGEGRETVTGFVNEEYGQFPRPNVTTMTTPKKASSSVSGSTARDEPRRRAADLSPPIALRSGPSLIRAPKIDLIYFRKIRCTPAIAHLMMT